MKVNQLTFHCALNYGAVLQTYALGKVLRSLGHQVSLVDLRPAALTEGFTLHPLGLLKRWEFARFLSAHCPPRVATTDRPGEMGTRAPQADAWVVGSDQVWNPEITGPFAGDFFLEDVPPGCKRLAYAASFGRDVLAWAPALRARVRRWLADFDGISVRETSGLRLCRELGAGACEQVLDPTLLLGDFNELLPAPARPEQKLLCMLYQPSATFAPAVARLAQALALTPLLLGRRAGGTGFRDLPHPAVARWVQSFRDASFVLTDSFHGLAFSLIFNKPFAVVPGNPERFCRLRDLLADLQLEQRIFASYEELAGSTRWKDPLPYADVNRRLADKRKTSLDFLRRHLVIGQPARELAPA